MRNLNEYIARKANYEDNCTGRFWEGRFKSQALLDETALLSCMMYVDLNPVRAKMADSLEASDFTSIQERIKQYKSYKNQQKKRKVDIKVLQQPRQLMPFGNNIDKGTIPFILFDYLELADFSSRLIQPNKRGTVSTEMPKLLNELNIEIDNWINTLNHFRRQYANFAGSKSSLIKCANCHHQSWYKGSA